MDHPVMTIDTPNASPPPHDPPVAVIFDHLTKRYRNQVAVDRLTAEVPAGTVTGFVGPNGAGKTTTLRMLLGLVRPTEGTARLFGERLDLEGTFERIGAMIEGPAFYPGLSARRNLQVLATLGNLGRGRIDEVLDVVGLTDHAGKAVRTLSLGMRQRLGIAAALLPDPSIVLLDEPTNGLDPAGIREMRTLIRGIADAGTTVVVSSHLLSEIEQICDRCIMIRDGQMLFHGLMADLEPLRPTTLVARPESVTDQQRLVEHWRVAGFSVRIEGREIHVAAHDADAAQLNRAAFDTGITLSELRSERASLEDTFFAMLAGEAS